MCFGPDGIKAEHLKYALDDIFILHLSILLSLCLTGGVVPHGFCTGTLIPILKKTNADPANPKNYRPVTVSSVLSKILELHIMDEFDDHNFAKYQYGFISFRGTSMATATCMAHDVSEYCVANGSPVYICSLVAEMAFDGIPHDVFLLKAMNVLSDPSWNLLYYWNSNMSIQIKWDNHIGKIIPVE